jgi:PKD repeat protein
MTAMARLLSARIRWAGALLALSGFLMAPAAAQGDQLHTVSPLPASDYSVRSVCATPAAGHAGCLALELVGQTPAARAHTSPLGMARSTMLRAGKAAEPCESPTAAEGCYGLRPQDLHSAYGLPTTASSKQTIALIDAYDDPAAEADLKIYDEEFHLPACTTANGCFTKVNEKGQAGPLPEAEGGWSVEISLDIETAHATCQNCHILLVEADETSYTDLEAAEETAVKMGATEISNSWSGGEPATDSTAFDHPGVVIAAASGDDGYLNWQSQNLFARGTVGWPASSPDVVAVGGTRLSLTSEGAWAGETVWNGDGATGSGCSEDYEAPSWQRELPNWSAVGCGSKRAVADISADADPYTGVAVYDSATIVEKKGGGYGPFDWGTVGGTSLASPLIASTFALVGGSGSVEYPAKTLYENRVKSAASLHDIDSGSNGECSKSFNYETGLSGCTAQEEAESSCKSEAICLAGPGYDGPSGVGTPDGVGAFQPPIEQVKKTQTIKFSSTAPTSADLGGPTYAVAATASSGLPVSLTSGTPWACSLAGGTVSFIGAGTCSVDASQAGSAEYDAASEARQSFMVGKGSQRTTFVSIALDSAAVGGPSYAVQATASSGLEVAFSSGTPSVCSLEWSTVSFIGAGTCTIDAEQAGNSNYDAAPEVRQSFIVGMGSQHITFTSEPPAAATIGGSTYAVTARATSGLAVSFSSGASSVCSVSGTTVSFIGAGMCTIDAKQAGDSDYDAAPEARQSFAVGQRSQSVEFTSSPPAVATVGGATYVVAAAASSGLDVAFSSGTPSVCSVSGSTVSFTGAGTCTIDADQAGSAEFAAAPEAQQTFVVSRRAQPSAVVSIAPASASTGEPGATTLPSVVATPATFLQQGETLTATPGEQGISTQFGASVALSADGDTMLVGGPGDELYGGSAWVYTRSGSTWTQQAKLDASEVSCGGFYCGAYVGYSVALSADGDTALVAGYGNAGGIGAAWVFTRSGTSWTQQGPALTGDGEIGTGEFGTSVALSADGNTALIGAPDDYGYAGAAWVFTRAGATWTQEGEKLVANDESEPEESQFGSSVALSTDGDTALIGGPDDNGRQGAAWVFTRSNSTWTQQGAKLTGGGETGAGEFGSSVALSMDGATALVGAPRDNEGVGAAWTYTRSGSTWTQDGSKLTGNGETGEDYFGSGIVLSADGGTALIDANEVALVFTRSGGIWTEEGEKLPRGASLAFSAEGSTIVIGGGDSVSTYVVSPQISSSASLSFGSQTVGRAGPVLWVQARNAGSAPFTPLSFSGPAQITGPDAADFAIPEGDDLCEGETLEPGQTCMIGVQFTADAVGWRSAALVFGTNNGAAVAPAVALRGTGAQPPNPAMAAPSEPAIAGTPVHFNGEGSSAPDGSINGYDWSFGDGDSAEGAAPTHTYAAAGTYSVTLTVTDNLGLTGRVTRSVVVKETQLIEFLSTAPASATVGGPTYAVSALASSGLSVSYSSATPSVCSLEGFRVSFLAPGTCTIGAEELGDAEYAAAPPTQQSFAVGKGSQVITFTSSPPDAATVGGSAYVVSATASSGLPVVLSSTTPSVCSLGGSTVSFLTVGTCTIDAGQAGDADYDAAVQAQQSFVVDSVPVLVSTTVPTPSTPSPTLALTPPFTPTPGSSFFSLSDNPSIDARTGAITFTASVANAGTFSWLLTFQNGKFGAFSASKTQCKAAQIKLHGKCYSATIVFGRGSTAAAGAGIVSFTVMPSASARTALENTLEQGRGLPVTAILTFHSSLGASPVSNTRLIADKLKKSSEQRRK